MMSPMDWGSAAGGILAICAGLFVFFVIGGLYRSILDSERARPGPTSGLVHPIGLLCMRGLGIVIVLFGLGLIGGVVTPR
jgi:hypothetical protein